jgi:DNA-binding XRE family transcriptional regulator
VKFFARLCKTQCFHDGNKRTALIFCNAILISSNLQIIRIVDHITFARKLISFYEDENKINDFYQYVKSTSNLLFSKQTHSYPGETIKKLLEYSNINENQLAKMVGVNRSHINKIIKGVSKPSNELAKSIASILHVHWKTLI